MKKLHITITLVALLAGIHQTGLAMDAPEEALQGERPPNTSKTQALTIVLREMIQKNAPLQDISAFIQSNLTNPGVETAALIEKKGISDLLYNIAEKNNHKATMNWLIQQRLVDAQIRFRRALIDPGDYNAAEFWLQHGAVINYQSKSGRTIISDFVYAPISDKSLKWLIEHGANPNLQDISGDTPLHDALWNRETEKAKLLLDHRARTDIKNKQGETARDIYFRLSPEDRQRMKDAGIAERLGIKDTDEK